ncbi:MAG: class I SAM-dependent methyltransferase [Gammaproteobacteria bacterium]
MHKTSTFTTDGKEQFRNDYEVTALLQKGFNAQVIDDLVAYILNEIPTAKEKPIKLLDLCCGDGGITHALLIKLQEAGIQVEKIVGYDISTEQIKVATEKHSSAEPRLEFKLQNIATMTDQAEYDVVICLFGLHWLPNINEVAEKIHNALKPDGKLMYFVPLEKTKLFALRTKLVNSPDWQAYFTDYDFSPFRSDPHEYFQAFTKLFQPENADGIDGMQTVEFTEDRFKIFLSSWMQELRHLDNAADKQRYLDELVASLPPKDGLCHDVETVEEPTPKIYFHERFSWFHGAKKPKKSAQLDEVSNMRLTIN